METITSKRSFYFYSAIFWMMLFWFVMGSMVLGIYIHDYNSHHFQTREYGLLFLFAALVAGAIYTIYRHIKNAPSLKITHELIKVNYNVYNWIDIENSEIIGKQRYIFGDRKEGVMLKFKNKKEVYFLDSMYSNISQIKNLIQSQLEKYDNLTVNTNLIKSPLIIAGIVTFKGNPLLGFRGMILLLYLAGLVCMLVQNHSKSIEIFLYIFLSSLTIWALCYFSYYFILSDDDFIVRNHYLLGFKKIYKFNNIKEVVFEQGSKMPGSVRVITKDYKGKLYRAETLSDRKWVNLKDELEKRQLSIRDEFVGAIVFYDFVLFKEIKELFRKHKK